MLEENHTSELPTSSEFHWVPLEESEGVLKNHGISKVNDVSIQTEEPKS